MTWPVLNALARCGVHVLKRHHIPFVAALIAKVVSTPAQASTNPLTNSPFFRDNAANTVETFATHWALRDPLAERPLFETGLSLSPKPLFTDAWTDDGPRQWTTGLDWFSNDLWAGRHYRFADPRKFSLLRRYTTPATEQYPSSHLQFLRRLDPARQPLVPQLNWRLDESALSIASLLGAHPWSLPLVRQNRCVAWATPRPVVVTGLGAEYDTLPLVDCDGAIDVFALDRVSVLARTPNTPNPGYPLPDSPNAPSAWPDEWIDGVRLLHPRLLWILQRIGEAFPKHAIQIMSGYRRDARLNSPHRQGRALDIRVRGVDDAELFAFCLSLKDVGCGYYPFHPFVHIDVRGAALARAIYWVDASRPGEPSKYVDSWPYVIDSGALEGALAGAGSD